MGTQRAEKTSLFVPKSYSKQAIQDLISGKTEIIAIELEHNGVNSLIEVAANLTIAPLSDLIEADIVIPLHNYQLCNDVLTLSFKINDQRIPLDQQRELRRITSPIDLVGASTLSFTIRFDNADYIACSYSFFAEWRKI